jgi:hypothetical protein
MDAYSTSHGKVNQVTVCSIKLEGIGSRVTSRKKRRLQRRFFHYLRAGDRITRHQPGELGIYIFTIELQADRISLPCSADPKLVPLAMSDSRSCSFFADKLLNGCEVNKALTSLEVMPDKTTFERTLNSDHKSP